MQPLVLLVSYIFSYFVGQADGLHLAWSRDGYNWTPLANNASLLVPQIGEDKLMRDPSICQGPDGTFHMVWTSSWTDRIIGYASSPDLIHWSGQQAIPVMMHEPEAHNCWAPELFYDAPSKTFWILWATTIPGRHAEVATSESEKGLNHRIYCTTTKDFKTFTPTRLYFDPGFSAIDAAVVRDPQTSELLMVVKNENSAPAEKNLRVTRSKNMRSGFSKKVSAPIHGDYWAEGPSPLFLEDGSLIVYFDRYREGRYGAVRSTDHGKTWAEVPADLLKLPAGIRHGTAFQVDDAVVDRLIDFYRNAAPKPLYTDPVHFGPTDPEIIQNRETGEWYMFYTSRRADLVGGRGAEWVHGSPIGIATSKDLVHWAYLRNAQIGYRPDAQPTYWAPAVVDDGKEYHMFLTYVPGIFTEWEHPRHIVHLTSNDLVRWRFVKVLDLMSEKVIDAGVARLKDGTWRMWYNQEPGGKLIASADSPDLYNWEDHGLVEGIGNCEGPKPFFWKNAWWLICDEWKGFAVYRSEDATHWTRQPGNLLQEPGIGKYDNTAANHCDVIVRGDRAYIYYFCHLPRQRTEPGQRPGPRTDGLSPNTTFIQVAELLCEDGRTITCDRNAVTVVQ